MKDKEKTKEQLLQDLSELRHKLSEFETAVIEMKLKVKSFEKNEENLHSLLRSMDDLVFIIGLDGTFNRFYQESSREDLFVSPKEFLGKHIKDVFPEDIAYIFQRALNAVDAYGKTQDFDYFMVLKDKKQWFNAKISPFKSPARDYFGYVCDIRNITSRKYIEEALKESEERYRAVMQQSIGCIFLADIESQVILEANKAMQRLVGYTSEELSGLSIDNLIINPGKKDIYREILRTLKEHLYFIGESKYRKKDGSSVEVEVSVNIIEYQGKKVFCVVSRDITPRRLSEEQLTRAATHDALTGLLNRQYVYERLANQLAMARRKKTKFALLYIDLDNFKEINDSLGHGLGDKLLKAVAGRLSSIVRREIDTLARMGGDEYMFILGDITMAEDAEKITENVLSMVRKPFKIEDIKHHITASIGISIYPEDETNYENLIKAADLAMYFAKAGGGNSYKRYKQDMAIKDLPR
jgi:diguanylate cyclase (GGDEF)-like protein/PAS domain S-box-containing protein